MKEVSGWDIVIFGLLSGTGGISASFLEHDNWKITEPATNTNNTLLI